MSIEFAVLKKHGAESQKAFAEASAIARKLRRYLNKEATQKQIAKKHVLGASSAEIQKIVLSAAIKLGFINEKKGLFKTYAVPSLRPDYYRPIENTGIILEVERGKTTSNNMDLLDFWKCHICEHANYLFLLVPQQRPSKKGSVLYHFKQVNKRLSPFFHKSNYANVEAVFIFGY